MKFLGLYPQRTNSHSAVSTVQVERDVTLCRPKIKYDWPSLKFSCFTGIPLLDCRNVLPSPNPRWSLSKSKNMFNKTSISWRHSFLVVVVIVVVVIIDYKNVFIGGTIFVVCLFVCLFIVWCCCRCCLLLSLLLLLLLPSFLFPPWYSFGFKKGQLLQLLSKQRLEVEICMTYFITKYLVKLHRTS